MAIYYTATGGTAVSPITYTVPMFKKMTKMSTAKQNAARKRNWHIRMMHCHARMLLALISDYNDRKEFVLLVNRALRDKGGKKIFTELPS